MFKSAIPTSAAAESMAIGMMLGFLLLRRQRGDGKIARELLQDADQGVWNVLSTRCLYTRAPEDHMVVSHRNSCRLARNRFSASEARRDRSASPESGFRRLARLLGGGCKLEFTTVPALLLIDMSAAPEYSCMLAGPLAWGLPSAATNT